MVTTIVTTVMVVTTTLDTDQTLTNDCLVLQGVFSHVEMSNVTHSLKGRRYLRYVFWQHSTQY